MSGQEAMALQETSNVRNTVYAVFCPNRHGLCRVVYKQTRSRPCESLMDKKGTHLPIAQSILFSGVPAALSGHDQAGRGPPGQTMQQQAAIQNRQHLRPGSDDTKKRHRPSSIRRRPATQITAGGLFQIPHISDPSSTDLQWPAVNPNRTHPIAPSGHERGSSERTSMAMDGVAKLHQTAAARAIMENHGSKQLDGSNSASIVSQQQQTQIVATPAIRRPPYINRNSANPSIFN
ncbi:hypothetical protein ACLOJK_036618 [Asimina triloba]